MVGDGFRVHNFFPSSGIIGNTGMSPFFLLDYNSKWIIPPSDKPGGVGVLILSGEPIEEPLVSGGPFLMNTEDEVRKAYEDFRNGLFGNME